MTRKQIAAIKRQMKRAERETRPAVERIVRNSERNARRRLAYHLRKAMAAAQGVPAPIDCCVMFQADVHRAAFGSCPVSEWRGRYSSVRGMKRVLGPGGLPSRMRQVARRQKWKRVDPAKARVGDIGLVPAVNGLAVVRMLHRNQWIGRNQTAWSVLPTSMILRAWSVC